MANLSVVVMDLQGNDSVNGTLDFTAYGGLSQVGKFFMVCAISIAMVCLGCAMEVAKIKAHIKNPKGVGIALVALYGVMPLTAFSLAKAFQLSEMAAVVVLICSCCPGGLLSNILSLAFSGDMNLSIVMTTCSTLLALGMMPLLLLVYCQSFEGLQEAVPYRDIVLSLLTILTPCGIGILLNHYRPQYSRNIRKAGLILSNTCFLVVVVLSVLENGEQTLSVLAPPMLAIALLMPMIGYTFGYLLSFHYRLTESQCRTVAMEAGCRNGQLCMVLVKNAFPREAVGPLFLFPVVYMLSQLSEALVLVLLFRTHRCWQQRNNKKGTYQVADPEIRQVGDQERAVK